MVMTDNGAWPAAQVEQLRELFAKGLSAGAIAIELVGRSRNAVIGKLGRIGLKLSPKATGPRPKPRQKRKRSGKNYRDAPWKPQIVEQFAPTEPVDLPPEIVANPVTLMELTADTCRWPCAGEGANTMFCGALTVEGKPYCPKHCSDAFRVPLMLSGNERERRRRHFLHIAKPISATHVRPHSANEYER
jgi:hypothetical protein